jgi:hypothetical protein
MVEKGPELTQAACCQRSAARRLTSFSKTFGSF